MKKLIFLLLLIPLVSFGQTDFRKMSWGDSVEDLKKTYPEATFQKYNQDGIYMLMQEGMLIGINVYIAYAFSENELVGGVYLIEPEGYKDSKDRLRDFYKISERLNEKYTMEREDEWIRTNYKDRPNDLDFAISIGDVILTEKVDVEDTYIVHTLSDEAHNLMYRSAKWLEILQQEQSDDF